ncbi:lipopolysaccharide biosynthesis protein [Gordonia sp. NPDC003504]
MIAARVAGEPGPGERGSGQHAPGESAGLAKTSVAVAVSGMLTAALGLVYWVVAGRLYPAREVGAAAAVITTATMLSAFGNLGLGAYLERFLPVAGRRGYVLPTLGLGIGATCGAVLATGFLLVGPTDEMFTSRIELVLFPVVVMVLSSFALLDHLSIAMGRATWSAQKNVIHAAVKLLAAIALAGLASRAGLVGTWIVTAAVAGGVLWWFAGRELRRRVARADATLMPPLRDQGRFLAGNYGVYIASAITPLILPSVVIARVGADHNAYFSIVWSLVSAVLVLLTMMLGPYVASMSAAGVDRRPGGDADGGFGSGPDSTAALRLTRLFVAIMIGGAALAAVGFEVIGPLFLRLAGPDYAEYGAPLLRLGAVALPLAAVGLCYVAISRVRCRLWPALVVQIISATIMLSATALWIGEHGLVAAGWAMILAEGTAAALVIIPVARAVWGRAPLRPVVASSTPERIAA